MRPLPSPASAPAPLDAALAGDPDARAALLEAHGPRVWALCRRLDPEPEDAYQDVWLSVCSELHRFVPDDSRGSLGAWIQTIAARRLIDRHRRRQVRPLFLAGPLPELAAPDADPTAGAEGALSRARLEQALAALPEAQRRLVVLHHVHDEGVDALSALEGVPVGTIKSRLSRARAALLRLLGGAPA